MVHGNNGNGIDEEGHAAFPGLAQAGPAGQQRRRAQGPGEDAGARTFATALRADAAVYNGPVGATPGARRAEAASAPQNGGSGDSSPQREGDHLGPAGNTPGTALVSATEALRVAAQGELITAEAETEEGRYVRTHPGNRGRGEGRAHDQPAEEYRDESLLGQRQMVFTPQSSNQAPTNQRIMRYFARLSLGRQVDGELVETFLNQAAATRDPIQSLEEVRLGTLEDGAYCKFQIDMNSESGPNSVAHQRALEDAIAEYMAVTAALTVLLEKKAAEQRELDLRNRVDAVRRSERDSEQSRERSPAPWPQPLVKISQTPPPDYGMLSKLALTRDEVDLFSALADDWGEKYLKNTSFDGLQLHAWIVSSSTNAGRKGADAVPSNILKIGWGNGLLTHARTKQGGSFPDEHKPVIEIESLKSYLMSLVDVAAQEESAKASYAAQKWLLGKFVALVPTLLSLAMATGLPATSEGWIFFYARVENTDRWELRCKVGDEYMGSAKAASWANKWLVDVLEVIVSQTVTGAQLWQRIMADYKHPELGSGPTGFSRAYFLDVLELFKIQAAAVDLVSGAPRNKLLSSAPQLWPSLHVADGGAPVGNGNWKGKDATRRGILSPQRAMIPVWPLNARSPLVVCIYIRESAYPGTGCHFCGGAGHAPFSTEESDWEGMIKVNDKSPMFSCPALLKALNNSKFKPTNSNGWKSSANGSLLGVMLPGGTTKSRQG